MDEISQVEQAIAALENQRVLLGDTVVDTALAPLREKLQILQRQLAAEQRRIVTVLFSDVSGFTAMAEHMDPEDVREIINEYFTRWTVCIEQHGGVIEKFIGDAVMAVFGLTTSREDDPENAILAALAMRSEMEDLNKVFRKHWGLELSMRVGIHTGPVVVSTLGERKGQDFVVVGDSVNLASRVQALAPRNGILITYDTYRHVRGVFTVQQQDPMPVRGRTEPVEVIQVLSAKPRAFREETRGVEGIETPFIGRQAELQDLQQSLHAVLKEKRLRWITVLGEAGIGKSRLMYEFDRWLDLIPEQVVYFKGRAVPASQNTPYALLRDLASFRFQIHDNDPAEVVIEKIERGISEFSGALRDLTTGQPVDAAGIRLRTEWISRLLGFSVEAPSLKSVDPRQLRDRGLSYIWEYFQAISRNDPVVILLEDLHWADDSSLDAITYVIDHLSNRPILVVCAARTSLLERRPDWGLRQNVQSERMMLEQLSPVDTRQLVSAILRKADHVPQELVELVATNADGNPFFIEEFIKMMMEEGVIIQGDEQWQVQMDQLSQMPVPQTLSEILQARLDSLDPETRSILQRASVVGRIFWSKAVAFLSQGRQAAGTIRRRLETEPDSSEQQIVDQLKGLNERELIYRRDPSSIRGTEEYQFKHNLLRDVTYESLLKSHRRLYHAQVARWLENIAQSSKRSDEFAGLIAEHYDLAQDEQQACEWYRRAAQQAIDRYANQEALKLLSRALELTGEKDASQRLEFLLLREKILHILGDRTRQREDLDAMQEVVRSLEPGAQGKAALQMANFLDVTSDYSGAIAWAQKAVHLAEVAQDPDLQTRALIVLGTTHWRQGHYKQVRSLMSRVLDLSLKHNLSECEGDAHRLLGIVADTQGAYSQALEYFQSALNIARDLHDRRKEGMCLNSLGVVTMHMNDYAGARRVLEESLEIKYELGDRPGQSITMNNLGVIAHNLGDVNAALRYYLSSYELFKELHDLEGIASILCSIGSLYGYVGDYATAGPYLEEGLQMCQQVGDQEGEAICWNALASYSLATGEPHKAYEQAARGLEISKEIDVKLVISSNLIALGDANLALKQPEDAVDQYQQAVDLCVEMEQTEMLLYALGKRAMAHQVTGQVNRAVQDVEEFLSILNDQLQGQFQAYTFGMDSFFQVFYGCYQVLDAVQDERAIGLLGDAYNRLSAQAELIEDGNLRRSFLEQVDAHRKIVQAYRQVNPA